MQAWPYIFAGNGQEYLAAIESLGLPCLVKPIMSSSGKGQSRICNPAEIKKAWEYAQSGGRGGQGRVIVEGVIDFDFEITLLTVRHRDGTHFCQPIGHRQIDGDYRESWQPQPMTSTALAKAQHIATTITDNLGGSGIFGVELFIKGDEVYFNEVSPRPHDAGLVAWVSQDWSEFALHVRAILGLPIPAIKQLGPAASAVILAQGQSSAPAFINVEQAISEAQTQLRLFGKPVVQGQRRLGVVCGLGDSLEQARHKVNQAAAAIKVTL